MTFTGGPLNLLNGKMGISAPYRSVPVMKLIRFHKPKSKKELEDLISVHASRQCECGIVSQGSIVTFGENLYKAQLTYWGEYRFSKKECIQWEYDLFITQSLKGGLMEKKAMGILIALLPEFIFNEAEGYIDEELRIDITVGTMERLIAGIQIKPLTFMKMRPAVITFSEKANKKWGNPVYYFYYDNNEEFINTMDLINSLQDQGYKGL